MHRLGVCYEVSIMGRRLRFVSWPSGWVSVLILALLLAIACESPTLPLPPPSTPYVSTQGLPPGQVRLASPRGAEPNAVIVIYNTDPAIPLDHRVGGAQADSNGTWDAVVYASSGDVLDVSQQFGTASSPTTNVRVP